MSWTRDGEVLDDKSIYHTDQFEDTYNFEIKNTEVEDAGIYTCTATNRAGEATSQIPLIVNGEECHHGNKFFSFIYSHKSVVCK